MVLGRLDEDLFSFDAVPSRMKSYSSEAETFSLTVVTTRCITSRRTRRQDLTAGPSEIIQSSTSSAKVAAAQIEKSEVPIGLSCCPRSDLLPSGLIGIRIFRGISKSKMASLATTVAGIYLPSCVYNASGPRTGSSAAMSKIAASASGGVLAKSATVESQTGNPQPRTWQSAAASLNSEGLPNSGIDYYISSQTITDTMGDNAAGKPYMVSISGKNLADNLEMLKAIAAARNADSRIAGVELNLACPNVIGKPIIAYDFDQMDSVLKAVKKLGLYDDIPLGVKMVRP